MRVTLRLAALIGVLLQFGLASTAAAVDGVHSVEQLLRKLSYTLQERTYRGLFTYEYGGTLDTLEIIHVVEDGVEYERLQHLSGPSREVVRQGRKTNCVNIAGHLLRGGFILPGEQQPALHQYYELSLAGNERVADRKATVVRLIPKDPYRYGLTLSVDRATGFPMKSLVISNNQHVLERIQFVELDMAGPGESFAINPSQAEYLSLAPTDEACASVSGETAAGQSAGNSSDEPQWRASWLPRGFVLSAHNYSPDGGHQMTYTDGLASFSVFVSPDGLPAPAQPTVAQRGATVALMLPLKGHPATVTVVGEVPPVTAEQVAMGVRPKTNGESR